MSKFLTMGSSTVDIMVSLPVDAVERMAFKNEHVSFMLLELGKKISVSSIEVAVGGGATNAAVTFSRLGEDTSIISAIGPDINGEKVKEAFKKDNITQLVHLSDKEYRTATSVILSSVEKNPSIFVYKDDNSLPDAKMINRFIINKDLHKKFDVVYTAIFGGKDDLKFDVMLDHVLKEGGFVGSNPGQEQIVKFSDIIMKNLNRLDYIAFNKYETGLFMEYILQETDKFHFPKKDKHKYNVSPNAKLFNKGFTTKFGTVSLSWYFKTMAELGCKYVCITDGANGVYISDAKHIYYANIKVDKLGGTVGAGDSFSSTMVYYLSKKHDIIDSLKKALTNTYSVLSTISAHEGLLSVAQIEQKVSTHKIEIIKEELL